MKLPKHWFLPREEDVLGRLRAQADTMSEAISVLTEWAHGVAPTATAIERLRELRLTQRHQRRALHTAVSESFSTPMEAEDIGELAEWLAELTDAVYALVREAELSATAPDHCLAAVVDAVAKVTGILGEAVQALPGARAADLADSAADELTAAEHEYRAAIADLENETDLRRELRRRELYRRMEHVTNAASRVARRIWFAVSKAR